MIGKPVLEAMVMTTVSSCSAVVSPRIFSSRFGLRRLPAAMLTVAVWSDWSAPANTHV